MGVIFTYWVNFSIMDRHIGNQSSSELQANSLDWLKEFYSHIIWYIDDED